MIYFISNDWRTAFLFIKVTEAYGRFDTGNEALQWHNRGVWDSQSHPQRKNMPFICITHSYVERWSIFVKTFSVV